MTHFIFFPFILLSDFTTSLIYHHTIKYNFCNFPSLPSLSFFFFLVFRLYFNACFWFWIFVEWNWFDPRSTFHGGQATAASISGNGETCFIPLLLSLLLTSCHLISSYILSSNFFHYLLFPLISLHLFLISFLLTSFALITSHFLLFTLL